ncbi:MAG: polysaccharide biosynthesis C-terminal domain-containing protein [Ginsengibacter sp.]
MGSIQFLKNQYRNPALRTMGIYTVTNFFGKGLSFLLLPLFTNPKYLLPADNGLLSLFSQATIFLLPFINLGVLQSASVDYFKLDKKNFKDFCTTGFTMAIVMAVFSLFIFFLFRGFLFHVFSFPPTFIWAIPLAAFMTFCYELVILLIRNRNDAPTYMKVNIIRISTELGLALIFIVLLAWGWWGRVASILIATGCIAIYAIYFFIKNDYLSGSIKKTIIYTELKYSIPIVAMQLSMFCLFSSDSFLLSAITKSNTEVGIYGMACVFGTIILTLSGALIQYMVPKINKALSAEYVDYTDIRKHFIMYISIMAFTFIILLFCVPVIYHLVINNNYWPGIQYYYFLSAGYFFWTITIFLYTFLLYHKQKKKLFTLAFISLIISLTSNYFFIKFLGSLGASISVCCSYFAVFVLVAASTKKYWRPVIYSSAA